jgi:hypothetical protein
VKCDEKYEKQRMDAQEIDLQDIYIQSLKTVLEIILGKRPLERPRCR